MVQTHITHHSSESALAGAAANKWKRWARRWIQLRQREPTVDKSPRMYFYPESGSHQSEEDCDNANAEQQATKAAFEDYGTLSNNATPASQSVSSTGDSIDKTLNTLPQVEHSPPLPKLVIEEESIPQPGGEPKTFVWHVRGSEGELPKCKKVMTAEERQSYRKRRVVGACNDCRRRKRKCRDEHMQDGSRQQDMQPNKLMKAKKIDAATSSKTMINFVFSGYHGPDNDNSSHDSMGAAGQSSNCSGGLLHPAETSSSSDCVQSSATLSETPRSSPVLPPLGSQEIARHKAKVHIQQPESSPEPVSDLGSPGPLFGRYEQLPWLEETLSDWQIPLDSVLVSESQSQMQTTPTYHFFNSASSYAASKAGSSSSRTAGHVVELGTTWAVGYHEEDTTSKLHAVGSSGLLSDAASVCSVASEGGVSPMRHEVSRENMPGIGAWRQAYTAPIRENGDQLEQQGGDAFDMLGMWLSESCKEEPYENALVSEMTRMTLGSQADEKLAAGSEPLLPCIGYNCQGANCTLQPPTFHPPESLG